MAKNLLANVQRIYRLTVDFRFMNRFVCRIEQSLARLNNFPSASTLMNTLSFVFLNVILSNKWQITAENYNFEITFIISLKIAGEIQNFVKHLSVCHHSVHLKGGAYWRVKILCNNNLNIHCFHKLAVVFYIFWSTLV